jgi:hypothetical protein
MSFLGLSRLIFHWMHGFSLAARLQRVSMQVRSTQTVLLLHFSLALVGFLDVQSIQTSSQERGCAP